MTDRDASRHQAATATVPALLSCYARRLWQDDPLEFALLFGWLVWDRILDLPDEALGTLLVQELTGQPDAVGELVVAAARRTPALVPSHLRDLVGHAVAAGDADGEDWPALTRLGRAVVARPTG